MFFDVNVPFTHVYTPPNICQYPPNFKFLEISLALELMWFTSLSQMIESIYLKSYEMVGYVFRSL